jgi:putative phosphoribosyl transferase
MPFLNRTEAGSRLGERLRFLQGEDVVVLALPHGGILVALEVARALHAPVDVLIVRKLVPPCHPDVAVGAMAEGGVTYIDQELVKRAGATPDEVAAAERRERVELDRRADRLRCGRPPLSLDGCTAVLVDEGIDLAAMARVGARLARVRGAERVLVAVPVASPAAVVEVGKEAEVICLETPPDLLAVGKSYRDFGPVTDDEVRILLEHCNPVGQSRLR